MSRESKLTGLLNPRKDPKKVRGREMPNQRQRRARRVVKGMAAEDLAPHSSRFRKKKMEKTMPGMSRPVSRTLVFQRRPPITAGIRKEKGKHFGSLYKKKPNY